LGLSVKWDVLTGIRKATAIFLLVTSICEGFLKQNKSILEPVSKQ